MANLQDLAFASNPIWERITTGTKQTAHLYDEAGGLLTSLTAEPFNGVASFRYDGIIQTQFKEGRTPLTSECTRHFVDKAIRAKVGIKLNNSAIAYYIFSRGVAQHGEREVLTPFHFLTSMKKLRWYKGYELTAAFGILNEEEEYWSTLYNGQPIEEFSSEETAHSQIQYEIALFDMSTNPLTPTGEYNGKVSLSLHGAKQDEITVESCKVPAHPFYVRWTNEQGGYDYCMMSCKQRTKTQLTTNDYYEVYNTNGLTRTLRKEGIKAVEASTGIVDRATLEAVARMPLSPDIRLYNEKSGEWVPVQIDGGETDIAVDQPTGELVFTFILPTIQTSK